MKIIFLDIDGVLNPYPNQRKNALNKTDDSKVLKLDPLCLSYLAALVKATHAKLVLSSTWRCVDWDGTYQTKENLKMQLSEAGLQIWDETPVLPIHDRGKEICMYLREHPEVRQCVILDDESAVFAYPPLRKHFVRIHPEEGLQEKHLKRAEEILTEFFSWVWDS